MSVENSFRGHVIDGTNLMVANDVRVIRRLVVIDSLRDTEIDKFQSSFDEEKVSRFQIRVHDSSFVDSFHRFDHLLEIETHEIVVYELRVAALRALALALVQHFR